MAGLAAPDVLLVPGRTGDRLDGRCTAPFVPASGRAVPLGVDRHRREPARSLLIRKHPKTGELCT